MRVCVSGRPRALGRCQFMIDVDSSPVLLFGDYNEEYMDSGTIQLLPSASEIVSGAMLHMLYLMIPSAYSPICENCIQLRTLSPGAHIVEVKSRKSKSRQASPWETCTAPAVLETPPGVAGKERLRQEALPSLCASTQAHTARCSRENRGKAAREMRCISLPYCTFPHPNITASPRCISLAGFPRCCRRLGGNILVNLIPPRLCVTMAINTTSHAY